MALPALTVEDFRCRINAHVQLNGGDPVRLQPLLDKLAEIEASTISLAGVVRGVYVCTDYGVLPANSAADNRTNMQALIDLVDAAGGGSIYVPPGDYQIGQNPLPGGTNAGCVIFGGLGSHSNIKLWGAGRRSRFILRGTVKRATYMFNVANKAKNIHFESIALIQGDMGADIDEQVHLINFGGQADFTGIGPQDCSVRFCYFGHVEGDMIRLFGELANHTDNIQIGWNIFDGTDHSAGDGANYNARSGVGVQRSCHKLTISNNFFTGVDDQLLDYEPSAAGENQDSDVISNNTFIILNAGLITIGGDSAVANHRRFVFTGNQIAGGRLFCLNVSECDISHNVIVADATVRAEALIGVFRAGDRTKIHGNHLIAPAGCGAAQIIAVAGDSIAQPSGISVTDNQLYVQNSLSSSGSVIYFRDINDASCSVNKIWMTGTTITGCFIVMWQPQISGTGVRVLCEGNTLRNDSATTPNSFFCASANGVLPVGQISVIGNQVEKVTNGARFVGGAYSLTPLVANNNFNTVTTPILMEVSNMVVAIGGNVGGVATYISQSDAGDPNTLAALDNVPIGSDYRARSGNAAVKKMWIKGTAGASGWTALY